MTIITTLRKYFSTNINSNLKKKKIHIFIKYFIYIILIFLLEKKKYITHFQNKIVYSKIISNFYLFRNIIYPDIDLIKYSSYSSNCLNFKEKDFKTIETMLPHENLRIINNFGSKIINSRQPYSIHNLFEQMLSLPGILFKQICSFPGTIFGIMRSLPGTIFGILKEIFFADFDLAFHRRRAIEPYLRANRKRMLNKRRNPSLFDNLDDIFKTGSSTRHTFLSSRDSKNNFPEIKNSSPRLFGIFHFDNPVVSFFLRILAIYKISFMIFCIAQLSFETSLIPVTLVVLRVFIFYSDDAIILQIHNLKNMIFCKNIIHILKNRKIFIQKNFINIFKFI